MLERDGSVTRDMHEDSTRAGLAEQGRARVFDRVRVTGGFAVRKHDAPILPFHWSNAFRHVVDRKQQNIPLSVHPISPLL